MKNPVRTFLLAGVAVAVFATATVTSVSAATPSSSAKVIKSTPATATSSGYRVVKNTKTEIVSVYHNAGKSTDTITTTNGKKFTVSAKTGTAVRKYFSAKGMMTPKGKSVESAKAATPTDTKVGECGSSYVRLDAWTNGAVKGADMTTGVQMIDDIFVIEWSGWTMHNSVPAHFSAGDMFPLKDTSSWSTSHRDIRGGGRYSAYIMPTSMAILKNKDFCYSYAPSVSVNVP